MVSSIPKRERKGKGTIVPLVAEGNANIVIGY
jgi:hypothetical protein